MYMSSSLCSRDINTRHIQVKMTDSLEFDSLIQFGDVVSNCFQYSDLSYNTSEAGFIDKLSDYNYMNYNTPQSYQYQEDAASVVLDPSDIALACQSNLQSDDLSDYVTDTSYDETYVKDEPSTSDVDESRLPSFSMLVSSVIQSKNHGIQHHYISDYLSEEDEDNVVCKKGKRGAKNILLWKFLLEQLLKGPGLIRWIDQRCGTFRFVDTIEISRLWGEKKRKSDMNFEKLSRAIRHYYRSGFMSRCEGTRLVYKINWRMVPKEWRQKFFSR
ncbi:hypothetical protein KUTeg_023546 [Tegillarca granosa]|uniref:ETS domain-containing protein n=1 Tax=Tegillarca granosa TaxID=220873 RepID=A0ABQ9E6V8_TEGGR|nr:hypothetical protein KUTeg_023546 [Tegillarca granosa]